MRNKGIIVEKEFEKNLDGIRFNRLSPNFKDMIREMFGGISPFAKITCERTRNFIKPDVVIGIKRTKLRKFVSIKSGGSICLQEENIFTFIDFLRECGTPEKHIQTLLYYQFGDGTLDGTGKKRYDYESVVHALNSRIKEFNHFFDNNVDIILKVVMRVCFDGVNPEADKADYIYSGDIDYGVIVSRAQMTKYINTKSFSFYDHLHIGPLFFRPHARYVNGKGSYEDKRYVINVFWSKLHEDIRYISNRYNS